MSFLAIKDKLLFRSHVPVLVRQDNARPNIVPNNPAVMQAGSFDSGSIQTECQPPNSPDFNGLDLVFFNSLEVIQSKTMGKSIGEFLSCGKCHSQLLERKNC